MTSRQAELETNLRTVESEIAAYSPTLIVVTKTYPVSDVEILAGLGVTNFGENRSSEGVEKSAAVPANWHYQGEIQSKKIREILSWSSTVHSLDNLAHAEKIERTLAESGGAIELFLQLSLDGNPERGGMLEPDLFELAGKVTQLSGIKLLGIMSVPPVTQEAALAFAEIAAVHQRFIAEYPDSRSLSAGMSGDYLIALDHGATHIRVGSKILGSRQYP
jgi:pyridoxal phosphate enzyme (YggS family)